MTTLKDAPSQDGIVPVCHLRLQNQGAVLPKEMAQLQGMCPKRLGLWLPLRHDALQSSALCLQEREHRAFSMPEAKMRQGHLRRCRPLERRDCLRTSGSAAACPTSTSAAPAAAQVSLDPNHALNRCRTS